MSEILACWERANAVMPPSDPANPDDPSVSLDTLAAIAHAKWAALDRVETELARLQQERDDYKLAASAEADLADERGRELARLREGLHGVSAKFTLADEERRRLQEGLRLVLDIAPVHPTPEGRALIAKARALLAEDETA